MTLEVIDRQSRRCESLLKALIEFSSRPAVVRGPCEVRAVVERVIELARPQLSRRRVHLEQRLSGAEPPGVQALERAKSSDFDLLLTDLRMPVLGGVETLMGLKQLHPELQVIVVTGFASDATTSQCLGEGAYGFVTKPFDLDHLLSLIEKAIDARKSVRQLSS
jgi:DNA-binding NtrC family response regulator